VQRALEHERDFSAKLLDALGALVCVIDREGRIVRFNQACQELSGYTIDEVRRQPFWELLIAPDEVEGVKEVVRFLIEERRPNQWENYWITRSGARRLIRWSNTMLLDDSGDFSCIIGTGIDITEQRRAEDERDRLLLEERRAREVAERAEQRAAFLAEAGRVLARSLDECGRALDDLARLAVPYLADWCLVRLVCADGLVRTMASATAEGAAPLDDLVSEPGLFDVRAVNEAPPLVSADRSVRVNGAEACVESLRGVLSALTDEQRQRVLGTLRSAGVTSYMAVPLAAGGRILGAMLFVRADEARHHGADELVLAEALAARAALALDNVRLYRDAQRALQAREDFLVIASHELKTPLTSLHVAVQALLKQARADGASERAVLLGAVERSSTRLGALVDELLEISHVSGGAPTPALQEVDLREVVEEVLQVSADLLRSAGCAASFDARGPTDGRWDRRWLVRIVSNLLSNAAKYGRGKPIDLELEGSEESVQLTVRDRGIGVPGEEQARIFDRFERAVSLRHYGGFGLGLWVVRRMVEALGGAVRVESRIDEGARFIVALPRRRDAATGGAAGPGERVSDPT
jgi:PAS domain S-box-containing protein